MQFVFRAQPGAGRELCFECFSASFENSLLLTSSVVPNFQIYLVLASAASSVSLIFKLKKFPKFSDLVNAGVRGFKCFLIHSGVDEFPSVSRDQAAEALDQLKVNKNQLELILETL